MSTSKGSTHEGSAGESELSPDTGPLTVRRRRLGAVRWAAPLAAAAVAIGIGVTAGSAQADPTLPKKSAEQLLTSVASAQPDGLSGTVTETANLGLPSMPSNQPNASSDFSSLLTGTHTLRVWSSGPDKSKVSLLGSYGESDLIRNGTRAWLWSSADKTAVRADYTGPAARPQQQGVPATPQEAAQQALAAVDPSTKTSVGRNVTVAGRPAYELVLQPKDRRSLVQEVSIAVDAATSVPLRVQVRADGQSTPAFSVGFTDVDFAVPPADTFTFHPPAGTTVQKKSIDPTQAAPAKKDRRSKARVVGTGWTSVLVAPLDVAAGSKPHQDDGLQSVTQSLPRVSGSWGSGRLLTSSVISAVITDDGRVAAGAVRPALLYAALQK